jgi:hypothetical protein
MEGVTTGGLVSVSALHEWLVPPFGPRGNLWLGTCTSYSEAVWTGSMGTRTGGILATSGSPGPQQLSMRVLDS